MNNLTIVNHDGQFTVDSRDVAEMIGKQHKDLLESIRGYIVYLTSGNFRSSDFFLEDSYKDGKGEIRPCYLLTRKGCDMVANKMTGEKGVLFTAAYVTKFEEMEKSQRSKPSCVEDLIIMQAIALKEARENSEKALKLALETKQQTAAALQQTQVLQHRVNNLDATNIDGTPRQRLNSMIRKYALDNGIPHQNAWCEFRSNFNRAYSMNIEQRRTHYLIKQGIKDLSYPEFLERTGLIEDALRVADKMLNKSA